MLLFTGTLEFLDLGETTDVEHIFLENELDGTSDAIYIPVGFPFGNDAESVAYVSENCRRVSLSMLYVCKVAYGKNLKSCILIADTAEIELF